MDDGCWIEAEDWLRHYYPEHEWCAYSRENIVIIAQYTNGMNHKSAQVSQEKFREWVSKTDFHTAMNQILTVNHMIHITDRVDKHNK